MPTIKTEIKRKYSKVWDYHIPIPKEVSALLVDSKNRRVIATIDRQQPFQCAIMSGQEFDFIFVSGRLLKEQRLAEGQQIELSLEKDTSEYGMDMPEELQVMLEQDTVAYDYFNNLTPGKQRALIHLVAKVKNTDSRINKALAICHHLNESNGNLDFKVLNQWIKHYNNL
jgi:hypothetical protein